MVEKYTKRKIVDSVYQKTGFNRREIHTVVDLFIEGLKNALVDGKVIELRGFGTFEVRRRKGRLQARNPRTGETVAVDSHGVVLFRAGRDLKRNVWNLIPKDTADGDASFDKAMENEDLGLSENQPG